MAKYEDNKDKMMQVIREFEKELAGSLSLNAEYHISYNQKDGGINRPNGQCSMRRFIQCNNGKIRYAIWTRRRYNIKGATH